ncbi:MAG: NAD(+) diphosphatase [Pseudomonadota bacterium]
MDYLTSPCAFAEAPLNRASELRADEKWMAAQRADPNAQLLPLWRGDPLIVDGAPGWLGLNARGEFPSAAPMVFLGLQKKTPLFAIDAGAAPSAEAAPFADIGAYAPLREAASALDSDALAIIGQARWLLDWHRRHSHCARCGAPTEMTDGGAKRVCPSCGADHFPRADPVAIVLATHDNACLLGRSPHFPPGYYSALAGYVEPCETPEACAVRELKEEAGVDLMAVRYCFSQPWPFPSSLMMGFIADAAGPDLTLDEKEIVDAVWVDKQDIRAILKHESTLDVRVPPRFTIARRLIETWAHEN